jgi:hypothetical protein
MTAALAPRASPREGGPLEPAHKDGGVVRSLGTGSMTERRGAHGGGGLPEEKWVW